MDGKVSTRNVLRNHQSSIVGAWIFLFFSPSIFCAEMEATIQAFSIVAKLNLSKASFEGDSLGVILALRGSKEHEDW